MVREKLEQFKEYLGNGEGLILGEMAEQVSLYLSGDNYNVLDIASDKDPRFSSIMAQVFEGSHFTHFRDNEILKPKIQRKFSKIDNLEIIYSTRKLKPPYDLAIAFLTLHELKNPKKSLRKAYKRLKENGKIIVIDYDLKWFNEVIKENGRELKDIQSNFSTYIFTSDNERKVLREESNCVENHTLGGLEDYVRDCEDAGFSFIDSKQYLIQTPWGENSKFFLYVGEKDK